MAFIVEKYEWIIKLFFFRDLRVFLVCTFKFPKIWFLNINHCDIW